MREKPMRPALKRLVRQAYRSGAHAVFTAGVWVVLGLSLWIGCARGASPASTAAGSTAAAHSAAARAIAAKPEAPAPTRPSPEPASPTAADKLATSNASPETEPPAIVIRQMEIYGSITFRAGKVLGVRSLVMTREEPPPAGSEGTLFRKVEVPGKASEWIPIARVTLKKFETGGLAQFVIVEELPQPPGSAGSGKPAPGNAFGKGTSVKAQMTL